MSAPRGLQAVERFVIPFPVVEATLEWLAAAGLKGNEAFVAWCGRLNADRTEIRMTTAIRPAQQPIRVGDSVAVLVEHPALDDLNRTCHERGEVLAGQVHTHPTEAFHSSTDDHAPIVNTLGALSLVVPDFARDGFEGSARWAWYRLAGQGEWDAIKPQQHILIER